MTTKDWDKHRKCPLTTVMLILTLKLFACWQLWAMPGWKRCCQPSTLFPKRPSNRRYNLCLFLSAYLSHYCSLHLFFSLHHSVSTQGFERVLPVSLSLSAGTEPSTLSTPAVSLSSGSSVQLQNFRESRRQVWLSPVSEWKLIQSCWEESQTLCLF